MPRILLPPRIQRWRAAAHANPGGFVAKKLRIPDVMGHEVDFAPNWAQQQYNNKLRELHKEGKPVRLELLKWRRAGITSWESGRDSAYLWGTDNARLGILAHQEDRAKEILTNFKNFDQLLIDDGLGLEKSKDNIFGLKYKATNAQVLIATAENPIKIRGDGIHWMTCTEYAHYYNKLKTVLEEVSPVVPAKAGSQIILESTGSLRGSYPHEHWMESDLGHTEYTTMFLCWLDSPDEREYFTEGQEQYEFDQLCELIADREPRLAEKNAYYKLTPEQWKCSWRMYHLQSNNDFDYFCREFPYIKEEAWSAGGSSYFGTYELGKAVPVAPMVCFQMDPQKLLSVFQNFDGFRPVPKVDDYAVHPNIKLWALPEKDGRYIIGSDSAAGEYDGDYSSITVGDLYTREEMCTVHGRLTPEESAHIIVSLARIYNKALVAPETNPGGGGMAVLNTIQQLGYHNIYVWRIRDSVKGVRSSNKLGWWTHTRSRNHMLGSLRSLFLDVIHGRMDDPGIFKDISLLREMLNFGTDPKTGIPKAMNNGYDDRVMAKAIMNQAAADEVYCTGKDLVFERARRAVPRAPVGQVELIKKRMSPEKVIANMFGANSGFMNNKFEI